MSSLKHSIFAVAGSFILLGTITVITPRVALAQKGTPTPTANVNVVNATLPVRDVDAAFAQPFQQTLTGSNDSFTVPAGKRLVIEHVSGYSSNADVSTCSLVEVVLRTALQGSAGISHHFVPTQTATAGAIPLYVFSNQTRLYADPGTSVVLAYGVTSGTPCSPFVTATVSGHFVDVPQ